MITYRVEELLPPGPHPSDGNWSLILETQDEEEAEAVFTACCAHTTSSLRIRRCIYAQHITAYRPGQTPSVQSIRDLIDSERI